MLFRNWTARTALIAGLAISAAALAPTDFGVLLGAAHRRALEDRDDHKYRGAD